MSVTTIPVTMEVPKEMKEIIDLLVAVVVKLKAKEGISSYADLLDELMAAVGGVSELDDEAKSEFRDEAAAYMVQQMMSVLLPVESGSEA